MFCHLCKKTSPQKLNSAQQGEIMTLKCSPYYILIFIRKFSLLLLTLPLQTLLMINLKTHTKVFFIVADILVFGTIFLCACISLRSIKLFVATSRFTLSQGVLHKQELTIENKKLQSICINRNVLQRLLGVCKVTLVSSTAKGEIFLSAKNLAYLPCSLPAKKTQSTCIFKSKLTDILIMSAGFSPALGAALSFAPLVRSLSNLSTQQLVSSANLWDVLGYKDLPPLLASLSSLLFIWWCLGVILALLRFGNLSLHRTKENLQIRSGVLSKHCISFYPKEARAIVFSQSLITLIFRRQRAEIILSSEQKSTRATAGCTRNFSDALLILNALEINTPLNCPAKIKPNSRALISYTLLPLLSLSFLCALTIFVSRFSPYKIEPHLSVFLCLWCCVWFLHRCLAFCGSLLSLSDSTLRMCTFSGLSFLEVFIPTDNIRCTKITQNIFQRLKGTCNLRVFIKHKKRTSFAIRHISIKKAAELSTKLCG